MDLHSELIPEVTYSPPIQDLFVFFGINWMTLSPVLWLLLGTLFGFFVLTMLKRHFGE